KLVIYRRQILMISAIARPKAIGKPKVIRNFERRPFSNTNSKCSTLDCNVRSLPSSFIVKPFAYQCFDYVRVKRPDFSSKPYRWKLSGSSPMANGSFGNTRATDHIIHAQETLALRTLSVSDWIHAPSKNEGRSGRMSLAGLERTYKQTA